MFALAQKLAAYYFAAILWAAVIGLALGIIGGLIGVVTTALS